jgi:hypothetical protein
VSYPRNAASPPIYDVGSLVQISDGALQTSGASARVKIGSGAWGAAAGSLDCDATSGIWTYVPSQAETDAESFILAVYKTGCISISRTIVPSANSTAGLAQVGGYASGQAPLQPLVAGRQISVAATTGAVELDAATQSQITNIENAAGYTLAVLAGACADPQTSSETYAITVFGSTFTVDMAGQTSTGVRTAPTLTKS